MMINSPSVTITGTATGHSDDHGPVIIRAAQAACVRGWFESPVFAVGTCFPGTESNPRLAFAAYE